MMFSETKTQGNRANAGCPSTTNYYRIERVILSGLVFALFIGLTSGLHGQQTLSLDSLESLDQAAEAFRSDNSIPGISIAIGLKGDVVYSNAFGHSDLENRVEASTETVYRTASIAKPMTAIAILQLVEQGHLSLDDSIYDLCPEFPAKDYELTVRQLLCHQGGIRHYAAPGESSGTKLFLTIGESISLFADDPLQHEPGTRYLYTTYGFSLLGRAVETTAGVSFRDYLQENVFDRAGMTTAGVDDVFRIIPNRTRGYMILDDATHASLPESLQSRTQPGDVYNCQLHDTSMKVPGGGLSCTALDLVQLGHAMLDDQLISQDTREAAWTAQSLSDGTLTSYGLGWFIRGEGDAKIISHSGGQAGTSTFLLIHPSEQLVVAVMSNLQGAPCRRLADSLSQLVRDHF